MSKFKYIISHGHHLIEIEGKTFLIDMGAPWSFCFDETATVEMNGYSYDLRRGGFTDRESTEKLVEHSVDGFIGNDIVTEQKEITFDSEAGEVTIGEKCPENAKQFRLNTNGYAFVNIVANGRTLPMILDTGAWVDYCSSDIELGEYVETVTDYHPGDGWYQADLHKLVFTLDGKTYEDKIAYLPPKAAGQVRANGAKGCIGINLFLKEHKVVHLSIR